MKVMKSHAIFSGRRCAPHEHPGDQRWNASFPLWSDRGSEGKKEKVINKAVAFPLLHSAAISMALKRTPLISVDPKVMQGQACIAGTRIPVAAVIRVIEHYGSLDDVVACYPHLTKEQAKQALCFSQMVLEPLSGEDEFTPSAG